jgi:hypothetical protein
MRRIGRATVQDLFWNFARAEFEVPPNGPRHTQPVLSSELRDRVLRGEREQLSPRDWQRLREAVLSTRSSIVTPLARLVRTWFLAELAPADVAELRVLNLRIFTSIVRSRRLVDLAAALDRGEFPRIWDPDHYRELRAHFDPGRMHGLPILVSARGTGPFSVVEGTTRLSVIASLRGCGGLAPEPLPVLLGVGAGLVDWEWY